jgi:general stress protein 26
MSPSYEEMLNKPWVAELLGQPILARLGTANPKTLQPHVVPVWFEWDGESLWISAFESTRKVKDVQRNRRISVLVDTLDPSHAVLFEGVVELISDPAVVASRSKSIYTRYLGAEGVKEPDPASWIDDPENRILKLTPEKFLL